jgi:hypothetical protein
LVNKGAAKGNARTHVKHARFGERISLRLGLASLDNRSVKISPRGLLDTCASFFTAPHLDVLVQSIPLL